MNLSKDGKPLIECDDELTCTLCGKSMYVVEVVDSIEYWYCPECGTTESITVVKKTVGA